MRNEMFLTDCKQWDCMNFMPDKNNTQSFSEDIESLFESVEDNGVYIKLDSEKIQWMIDVNADFVSGYLTRIQQIVTIIDRERNSIMNRMEDFRADKSIDTDNLVEKLSKLKNYDDYLKECRKVLRDAEMYDRCLTLSVNDFIKMDDEYGIHQRIYDKFIKIDQQIAKGDYCQRNFSPDSVLTRIKNQRQSRNVSKYVDWDFDELLNG